MDYSYSYDSMDIGGAEMGAFAALGSMMMVIWVISMAVCVIQLVAMWKIYVKAGRPGWGAIVPIYNTYLLFDMTLGNGWLFLTMLIPFVNIYFAIKCYLALARKFGQPGIFALGLILMPPVFLLILAFGKAAYGEPSVTVGRASAPAGQASASGSQMSREDALAKMRQQRANRE